MSGDRVDARSDVRFQDREDAGRTLARFLAAYAGRPDVLVLALPRGGVPVGAEVARALRAPLDVFVVRKVGAPSQPELAIGAIATGGTVVVNQEVIRELGIPRELFEREVEHERREVERRERSYRGARPPPQLSGKTVILVDDGLATGATMRAAARAARSQGPARVVVAVPVGARDTCAEMGADADEVVCVRTPEPFLAVGLWYRDFSQTSDEEVREILESRMVPAPPPLAGEER